MNGDVLCEAIDVAAPNVNDVAVCGFAAVGFRAEAFWVPNVKAGLLFWPATGASGLVVEAELPALNAKGRAGKEVVEVAVA